MNIGNLLLSRTGSHSRSFFLLFSVVHPKLMSVFATNCIKSAGLPAPSVGKMYKNGKKLLTLYIYASIMRSYSSIFIFSSKRMNIIHREQ